jgi:hypothetical protein
VYDELERQMRAREARDRAMLVSMLLFLWGGFSLTAVPWHPFGVPNLLQALVGGAALVWLLTERRRPRHRAADLLTAGAIIYTLLLLPWTAVEWSRLGRPWEAFAVPHIGMLAMALIAPRPLWSGVVLVAAFAAETAFAYFWPLAHGLGAALPSTEPYLSLMIATLAGYLLSLRRRRRHLVARQLRAQAESETLERLGPLFSTLCHEVDRTLAVLSAELRTLDGMPELRAQKAGVARALDRIGTVGTRIERLAQPPPTSEPVVAASAAAVERRFLTDDVRAGALGFAAISASLALPFLGLAIAAHLGRTLIGAMVAIALASLGWLALTRRRAPSMWRSAAFILILWALLLTVATLAEPQLARWAHLQARPYTPFIPHKLLLVTLPLVAPALRRITTALILVTVLDALLIYLALRPLELGAVLSMVEPWTTLAFAFVGLALTGLGEQRRVASLAVLRAESHRLSLARRARLLFALRDQLNSPLQALVLYGTSLARARGDHSQLLLQTEALVSLSRRLAGIGWDHEVDHGPISVDSGEL